MRPFLHRFNSPQTASILCRFSPLKLRRSALRYSVSIQGISFHFIYEVGPTLKAILRDLFPVCVSQIPTLFFLFLVVTNSINQVKLHSNS